jgi:hypothetical protein
MGSIGKGISLLIVVILAVSSLMMVESAFAQSIPKPSVPTFTVQYIVYTSYLASTSTINPYTGQNETTSYGRQIDNQTIEFTIKNQPFTPFTDSSGNYIGLYYNFRFKGHYGDEWTYYPFYVFHNLKTNQSQVQTTHSYGPYTGEPFIHYSASNSDYTVLSIELTTLTNYPTGTQIPNGSLVDFQVQAQIGHIDDIPSGMLAGDFYNFTGESSDWNNTQTISINYNSNSTASTSPSPNPSPSPTVPEFSSWTIPLLLTVMVALAGLLVYHKRKTKTA